MLWLLAHACVTRIVMNRYSLYCVDSGYEILPRTIVLFRLLLCTEVGALQVFTTYHKGSFRVWRTERKQTLWFLLVCFSPSFSQLFSFFTSFFPPAASYVLITTNNYLKLGY